MPEIRLEPSPSCLVCGARGERLYRGLRDRLLGVPGSFDVSRCGECGLLWLDPRPIREDLPLCYAGDYFTHSQGRAAADPPRRWAALRDALRGAVLCGKFGYSHLPHRHSLCALGPLLSAVPAIRARATFDLEDKLPPFSRGLLVDVGCGRGTFLHRMRELGWEVLGVEPDPEAAKVARGLGLKVLDGTLEQAGLAEGSAAHVNMSHVLEHLPEPAAAVRECRRILRPGGRLVIRTPNAAGLGHAAFKDAWLPLDPPRHLFVFSPKNLRRLLEREFSSVRVGTLVGGARETFDEGTVIAREGKLRLGSVPPQPGREAFARKAWLGWRLGLPWGDELQAVAVK